MAIRSKHFRFVAKIGLATHILPNFILSFGGRRHIKNVKRDFRKLKSDMADEKKADEEVNIDAVYKALEHFFHDSFDFEKNVDEADEDVFVMEYRAVRILNKFKNDFSKIAGKSNLPPEVSEKLTAIKTSHEKLTSSLEPKMDDLAQEIRREGIGRHMVRDITLEEWVAIFFQMKHRISHLRRTAKKVELEEHKLVHELNGLVKKPTKKNLQKVSEEYDQKFAPALDSVVADAVFVEKMVIRLRVRFEKMKDKEKQEISRLLEDGFPKTKIDEINQGLVKKVEDQYKDDLMAEYENARALVASMRSAEL